MSGSLLDKNSYNKTTSSFRAHPSTTLETSSIRRDVAKATWRAPVLILVTFALGLGLAFTHHILASKLNNQPVADVPLSQAWVFRFGTALAFLTKLALATNVGVAYVQYQWLELHAHSYKVREIDALTSVLGNVLSFLDSTVWLRRPGLALMAVVSWSMPLAAIIAPGSLTVVSVHTVRTTALQVPQPQFNFTNFGHMDIHSIIVTDPRIDRLAFQVASSGEPVSLKSAFANETYHVEFDGPAVRCTSANESIVTNLTAHWGITSLAMRGSDLRYLSWTPPMDMSDAVDGSLVLTLDYTSEDATRIFVMTNTGFWNKTRYDITTHYPPRQVNVTECLLFNASYSVDFTFQYPNQTREVSISQFHNPVRLYDVVNPGQDRQRQDGEQAHDTPDGMVINNLLPLNETDAQIASYGTLMDAFGTLLVGSATTDRYNGGESKSTSWKIIDIDWSDGHAVQRSLEQLFQNITLSVLSDDSLTRNSSTAETVPVAVTTWPATYIYSMSGLLVPYGVAVVCALCSSVIGMYAFMQNSGSYQNLFSTYLRAAEGSSIGSQMDASDDGIDPLPKALAQYKLALGGYKHVDETNPGDAECEGGGIVSESHSVSSQDNNHALGPERLSPHLDDSDWQSQTTAALVRVSSSTSSPRSSFTSSTHDNNVRRSLA